MALCVNGDNLIYFDSFKAEHIQKFKNPSTTEISKQMFSECKYMIQRCVDTFVLDLLILC